MLFRRAFLSLSLAATLTGAVCRPVLANNPQDARAFVQHLADTAMNTVAVKGLSDDERIRRFRTLFVEAFDLPDVGKSVMGRYWKVATQEQQQEFLRLFEEIQVYTWARRFKDYSGETLDILGTQIEGDGDTQVQSRIKRDKQEPIDVAWRVHKVGDSYKVADIKVEGASMTLTHRSEYASVIQGNGGQVDGLLAVLRKKITQLQAEQSAAK